MKKAPKVYGKASRPRKIPGQMNKTEAQFATILEAQKREGRISEYWYERVTLKLADDCRYTFDFLVLTANGSLDLYEVKGEFAMEDAIIKLKVAAELFPFRFHLAKLRSKKNGGAWEITEVKSNAWAEAA